MRKLIVTNIISLDGYHEGQGNDVMALPMDAFFDSHNAERLRAAGTLLLGRKSYELFRDFWPSLADDPEKVSTFTDDPEQREVIREISRLNNAIEKVVVSDGLTADRTAPWTATTRVVARAEAHQRIAELKRGQGGDILVFGSRTLWNDLLAAGLVDELHLMIGAAVLGAGTPAFADGKTPPLRLLGTRSQEGSDNLLVRYAVGSGDERRR
ncbi:dihydrofolate reductase family protein [Nonomuraea dietziae]|uniref:Dihydrofolate reductase n=1 Tax=Nonomuraea dietziae TaxID=65515 RepID=A0A7W5YM47_9ACTN|nr:dihydrofolate reductase family protein [Nonomuraea dietziae]MBB3725917.1 dihydrofolate reductase [Nonomuraea dietziae]